MEAEIQTYQISADGKSIKCLRCGFTSYHPKDVDFRYCAGCRVYHDDIWPPASGWWLLNAPYIPAQFMNEADLEKNFPSIPWREPLPARCTDGSAGLSCRFCIAIHGLKGHEIKLLPKTEAEFEAHMKERHPRL